MRKKAFSFFFVLLIALFFPANVQKLSADASKQNSDKKRIPVYQEIRKYKKPSERKYLIKNSGKTINQK